MIGIAQRRRSNVKTCILDPVTDDILSRVERFHFPRGAVIPERRNRGYTLYHARSGAPVARLRPTGRNDSVEVLSGQRARSDGLQLVLLEARSCLLTKLSNLSSEYIFWALC